MYVGLNKGGFKRRALCNVFAFTLNVAGDKWMVSGTKEGDISNTVKPRIAINVVNEHSAIRSLFFFKS